MRKMEKCELCHHKMKYLGLGRFQCSYCGNEKLDEYGKLREFLDEILLKFYSVADKSVSVFVDINPESML